MNIILYLCILITCNLFKIKLIYFSPSHITYCLSFTSLSIRLVLFPLKVNAISALGQGMYFYVYVHLKCCHTHALGSFAPRGLRPRLQPSLSSSCLTSFPGEKPLCEKEKMRCKGHQVPIGSLRLCPICAQSMPLYFELHKLYISLGKQELLMCSSFALCTFCGLSKNLMWHCN